MFSMSNTWDFVQNLEGENLSNQAVAPPTFPRTEIGKRGDKIYLVFQEHSATVYGVVYLLLLSLDQLVG